MKKSLVASIAVGLGVVFACQASYTELEYIQGTGSTGKQWIYTGFTPTSETRLEMKVRFMSIGANQAIYCARTSGDVDSLTGFLMQNGNLRFDYRVADTGRTLSDKMAVDTDYVIVVDGRTQAVSANGQNLPALTYVKNSRAAGAAFDAGSTLALFASHQLGTSFSPTTATSSMDTFGSYRLYYLRAFDAEGNLVADFRPARDDAATAGSVAAYGVYDRVGKVFYPNRGTKTFEVGAPLVGAGGTLVVANDAIIAVPSAATVPAAGSRPCAADEHVACSATPFVNEAETLQGAPVGYTLETLDRATGLWSAPVFHAGTSCDYVQSGTDAVRLTWKWEIERTADLLTPIRDGLQYRLDASDRASLDVDENGDVTAWRSNLGDLDITFNAESALDCPYYNPNAFGDGIPGVVFGIEKDGYTVRYDYGTNQHTGNMIAEKETTNATVILVMKTSANNATINYLWGCDNTSKGLSGGTASGYSISVSRSICDISLYVNGEKKWLAGEMRDDYYPYTFNIPVWVFANRTNALVWAKTGLGNCRRNYGNSSEGPRSMNGPIAEVLVWDRPLTDDERIYMDEYVRRKWLRKGVGAVWTGEGATPDWNDADNWSPKTVPASGQQVILEDAAVSLASGERYETANIAAVGGSTLSVNGATLVGSTAFPANLQLAFSGICGFDVPVDKTLTLNGQPAFAAGTTLTVLNRGTLAAGADWTGAGVTLDLASGAFDLKGTTQTFAAVTGGHGQVVNSTDEPGTLVLDTGATGESSLEARVADNVIVRRTGNGELKVAGQIDNTEVTSLEGGLTTATTEELPTIEGCILHLDATRLDSIVTNEEGFVTSWRSLTRPDFSFDAVLTDMTKVPYYNPEAMGGRGAISFGQVKGTTTKQITYLVSSITDYTQLKKEFPIRTFFFVLWHRTFRQFDCPLGSSSGDKFIYRGSSATGNDSSTFGTYGCDGGDVWVNGECLYDGFQSPAYTNAALAANVEAYGTFGLRAKKEFPMIGSDTELVAVRRKNTAYDWGGYIPAVGGENQYNRFIDGWFCEAVAYDRVLSDDEFKRVQNYLMRKWDVKPRSTVPNGGAFAPTAKLALKGGATLDLGLGDETQTVAQVTVTGPATVTNGVLRAGAYVFGYGADGVLPALTVTSPLDLADATLAFEGPARKLETGKVILAPGGLLGDFSSVDWGEATPSTVTKRGRFVRIGELGLMLFVK